MALALQQGECGLWSGIATAASPRSCTWTASQSAAAVITPAAQNERAGSRAANCGAACHRAARAAKAPAVGGRVGLPLSRLVDPQIRQPQQLAKTGCGNAPLSGAGGDGGGAQLPALRDCRLPPLLGRFPAAIPILAAPRRGTFRLHSYIQANCSGTTAHLGHGCCLGILSERRGRGRSACSRWLKKGGLSSSWEGGSDRLGNGPPRSNTVRTSSCVATVRFGGPAAPFASNCPVTPAAPHAEHAHAHAWVCSPTRPDTTTSAGRT
eukprot:351868-Chlamydomonas_euryale.AAC.4